MNTSDVLNEAADRIAEAGWQSGAMGWTGSGGLCLEGGLVAALGIDDPSVSEEVHAEFRACPAYQAVLRYLADDPALVHKEDDRPELWRWNDAEGREQTRVVEVLRAAAVVEAARESDVAGVVAGYRAVVGEQVQA